MMENSWYMSGRDTAGAAAATKDAEEGTKNVVTSIHAGYSDPTQVGTVTVTIGGAAVFVVDMVGNLSLVGIDIAGDINEAIAVTLSAGEAMVDGSVLVNGYTK